MRMYFHHNMWRWSVPPPAKAQSSQRHPGSHPLLPKKIFTPSVLFSSTVAAVSLILCCPIPLAIASSFTPLQNQIFRRQYLHILSPPSHFPFTPNALPFGLSNHCSSAFAKGNSTSTQANPWNTRLSSSHSAVHSIWHSWFSSYTAGYSFPVSFSDSSSFVRYPDVVSSKALNSFLCPFSLSELIHDLVFNTTDMHVCQVYTSSSYIPLIFRLVITIYLLHISTQMSNKHLKFNRSELLLFFFLSPDMLLLGPLLLSKQHHHAPWLY